MKLQIFFAYVLLISPLHSSWALKTLTEMSLEEKIGQLFMIAGYVDAEYAYREIGNAEIIEEIDHLIEEYHIGGIAYVAPSESVKQVCLTNHYQEISKYPILIAQDLEWGLAMRLKDGLQFPKNITLGAIDDNALIYEMGKEIGNEARLIGVHMNLSPVLDVNMEPENLAINVRSFGSSPELVAEKGVAMIRGLQDAGIIASAKHFPGLGDITIDPHLALPYNKHSIERLRRVELYPFTKAIRAGVLSIQTEHLIVPSLEPSPHTPSSLSPRIVTDLLKRELGFKGLVLSGAMRMKALTDHFSDEEIALKAFLAGHDMLLMPHDLPKAYAAIQQAWESGLITEQEIDERVLKILQLKEKVGLNRERIVPVPLREQLNSPFARELKRNLYRKAIDIRRNHENLIPIVLSKDEVAAYVQLGESSSNSYWDALNHSLKLDPFMFPLNEQRRNEEESLLQQIDKYPLIILSIYPADPRRIAEIRLLAEENQKEVLKAFKVHGITESLAHMIDILQLYQTKTIVVYFGNPYGTHFLDGYSTFMMAYEPDNEAEYAAASLLFE